MTHVSGTPDRCMYTARHSFQIVPAIGIVLLTFLAVSALSPTHLQSQKSGVYQHYEVHDTDLFTLDEYRSRRSKAVEMLNSGEALIVRAADLRNRSNDVDYEYRQRNSLLYLTGVLEQQSALVLLADSMTFDGVTFAEVLFVRERNEMHETWEGVRMGPVVASKVTGIDAVMPYEMFNDFLRRALPQLRRVYYDDWRMQKLEEPLSRTEIDVVEWAMDDLSVIAPNLDVKSAGDVMKPLRAIKSAAEVEMMQRAVDISIEGHRQSMRFAEPGLHEYELEAVMEFEFHRRGARAPGYPSIVGSGPNTCILHYIDNRRATRPGDLVLMDCGAEYHGYSADITRTFPVDGTFSVEQRAIYELVLAAQEAAIDECQAGNRFRDPHETAAGIIKDGLVDLGIMAAGDNAFEYFMHGTSHYLGLDVHDVSDGNTLRPGMVLTVEPGIYIAEGSDCDRKWWNIGVRIEDDVLITENGPVVLSAALEKTVNEVEALMKQAYQAPSPE